MHISANTTEIPSNTQTGHVLTYVGNQTQLATPRPPGFENFRTWREQPQYGMPTSLMSGLHNNTSTHTQPTMTTFSPVQNSGSGMNHVGRNTQNQGLSNQLPILITDTQAAFRQQMDTSNHVMVGVLAREMNTIFSPLIHNINRTNQDNTQSYQQMSV